MKYLYGAAIQGIQSFIFQTDKLKEIVGASELVERICTEFFKNEFDDGAFNEENKLLSAAGNIKYIFDNEADCKKIVLEFPLSVMKIAPGITISQAVVKYSQGELNEALSLLEEKLKAQRNKVSVPVEIGYMGIGRVRRTGGLAFNESPSPIGSSEEENILDKLTIKKINEYRNQNSLFKKISNNLDLEDRENDLWNDTDKLFMRESKSWIAVVHADGNGLGSIIQNLNKNLKEHSDDDVRNAFKSFSQALDKATITAAQIAFEKVIKSKKENGVPYPIRPIILGGDDMTAIVQAELALDYTVAFLNEFQKASARELVFLKKDYSITGFENGISSCAGIAYVKKSYPFHYAINLAEKLCTEAKYFVKKIVGYQGMVPRSALSFFKIQDSFIETDLKSIKQRSLEAINLSFDYGPYLIGESINGHADIISLINKIKTIEDWNSEYKDDANGISKLRQWVTETFKDESTADFMLDRMKTVNRQFIEKIGEIKELDNKTGKYKSIVYDLIQLTSLK